MRTYPSLPVASALVCALAVGASLAAAEVPPLPSPCTAGYRDEALPGEALRSLVEEDWLRNLEKPVTTATDAAGGCDGVKNGLYAFHVGSQAQPWWQVDLGEVRHIGRIKIFNRLDYAPGLHNADTLHVLFSTDGAEWALVHDQAGNHFGGITGAPPLEVRFPDETTPARFVRLTIPSPTPIFLHLDEVEVYATDDDTKNIALGQPADQSSLSPWSTAKLTLPLVYPTAACLDRGRRLAAYLQALGVDVSGSLDALEAVAGKLGQLSEDAPENLRKSCYIEARWAVRQLVFQNPLLNFGQLLFVKRFTQETYPDVCLNHMPWVSKPGGDLCVLQPLSQEYGLFTPLATPEEGLAANVRYLLNNALGPGHVHGVDLWFDGSRIVFGYARAESPNPPEGWLDRSQSYRLRREIEPIHIYELRLEDGQVRQLTDGQWSDLDPAYAPNGDIVFVSERCGTSLQCNEYDKDETSCNLYVMRPDGSGIRRMSVNKDGDYLPHTLDNGLMAYTRWEYHERSWAFIQSIWIIRPDGTGADALFKQHFVNPWALEDVRSIPGSEKLVAIAAGHHTLPVGPLVIVNHGMGVNEPRGIGIVTPNINPPEGGMDGIAVPEGGTDDPSGFYATPWALSDKFFLTAYTYGTKTTEPAGYGLYLVDVYGNKELLYRDPAISCFSPIPLRPRPRPPVLPDTVNLAAQDAVCYVSDIAYGCEGLAPESVRYLRIAEPIGWPYDNHYGGHRFGEDHRYGGPGAERKNLTNWTPVRILGDVPVQPDGSVRFRVPADTAVYFQLLDEDRMELRRMRSFISFQPGESRSCAGCHETRSGAPVQPGAKTTLALLQEPATPLVPPWGNRPINFLRDIQPVFDTHCLPCHGGLNPAGGLDFGGGLITHDPDVPGYGHNRAFETILANNLAMLSPARMQDASITPPLAYGARNSRLLTALKEGVHPEKVALSEGDRLRLVLWLDANAPYHDEFVNKRPKTPPYDLAADDGLRQQILRIHERRCAGCHAPEEITKLEWIDLAQPARSRFLSAPLGTAAGGAQRCTQPIYTSEHDPDYAFIRNLLYTAATNAWAHPRRDLIALNRPPWTQEAPQ